VDQRYITPGLACACGLYLGDPSAGSTIEVVAKEPQARILATPPAHRPETIVGPDLDLSTFFDVWLHRSVKPTEW
jgi:hypothetical protein